MRMSTLCLAVTAVVMQLLMPMSRAVASVDARNLLRNGDFEESGMPPANWSITMTPGASSDLVADAVTGANALKLSLPAAGTITVVSDGCAVTPGDDYLFTFWYRADGLTGKGYLRVYAYLVWLDGNGKEVENVLAEMPYVAVPAYRVATTTATAPARAAKAMVRLVATVGRDYAGQPSAFYFDQLRLMHLSAPVIPPNAQKWVYLQRMPSDSLKMVADKDAAGGEALVAVVGSAGTMTFGPDTMEQPVGDYVVNFRLKVKDNTKNTPVANLDVIAPGCLSYLLARKTLLATDFKQPGVYQDFPLRFIRPEEGMTEFRVSYAGTTDLTYDTKTVSQLAPFPTDKEQAAIWLGGDMGGQPAALPATTANNTVLVLAGLDHRILFPGDKLSQAVPMPCRYAYLANIQTGFMLDSPLPKKLDDLNGVGLVVLADVPAAALNGLMGRRTLRQFVERGGGLLVFGGPLSLGKGGYAGCALEPALPITTTGGWDLVKSVSPAIAVAKDSPLTRGLRWNQKPVISYYQRVTPRPGAEVLLTCDGAPLLVTAKYGKGRVAVISATDLGDFTAQQVPFYLWPDYPTLLSRITQWLMSGH